MRHTEMITVAMAITWNAVFIYVYLTAAAGKGW